MPHSPHHGPSRAPISKGRNPDKPCETAVSSIGQQAGQDCVPSKGDRGSEPCDEASLVRETFCPGAARLLSEVLPQPVHEWMGADLLLQKRQPVGSGPQGDVAGDSPVSALQGGEREARQSPQNRDRSLGRTRGSRDSRVTV